MSQNLAHNVLQLHGGGSLVLSGLLKCVILKKTTGRRIKDLFQTILADSGGAIIALCLEKISEEDLLGEFVKIIGNTLPNKRFYYTQTFTMGHRRFDNSVLHNQLKDILQDTKLAEFTGNLIVGVHQYGEGSAKFQKFTSKDGITHYKNASSGTPLSAIAKMTSTIPGVYNELVHHDPEYEGEIYLDALINQAPLAVLCKIREDDPDSEIYYVQMGNIEDKEPATTLLSRSAMASQMMNLHWKYRIHQLHSSHLDDVGDVIGNQNAESLITYSKGNFSPADPSLDQLTRLVVETLADVSSRQDEYTKIALRLNDNEPLCMSVEQAVEDLKTILDPMMKKRKVYLSGKEVAPVEFPSPIAIRADRSPYYQMAYNVGELTRYCAPRFCEALVANDFKIGAAFRLSVAHIAHESGLRKLPRSPSQRNIEP